jgi:hypothetical protein
MGIISEDEVYPGNRGKNAKYNAANSIVFWVAIYAVKASFLALYWNIFEISTRFRLAWAISSVYVFTSFGMTIMWSFWICGEPLNFLKEGELAYPRSQDHG